MTAALSRTITDPEDDRMDIAVLGTGFVGGTLDRALVASGHHAAAGPPLSRARWTAWAA